MLSREHDIVLNIFKGGINLISGSVHDEDMENRRDV